MAFISNAASHTVSGIYSLKPPDLMITLVLVSAKPSPSIFISPYTSVSVPSSSECDILTLIFAGLCATLSGSNVTSSARKPI